MDYRVERRFHPAEPEYKDSEPYEEVVFNLTPFNYFDYIERKSKAPDKYVPAPLEEWGPIYAGKEDINPDFYYPNGFENREVYARYRGQLLLLRIFREQSISKRQLSWGRALSVLMADYFSDVFDKVKYYRDTPYKDFLGCFRPDHSCSFGYFYKAFNGEYSVMKAGEKCPYHSHVLGVSRNVHQSTQVFERTHSEQEQVKVSDIDCMLCPCYAHWSDCRDVVVYKEGYIPCKVSPFHWPAPFEWPIKE